MRTQRGTFQKYYAQAEIKVFLKEVLDEEAIPVTPGVHYVFRDKDVEQRFLVERDRSRRNRLRDPSVLKRPRQVKARRDRMAERYARYESELEALWDLWLGLGRRPDESELDDAQTLTKGFGSLGKALRFLKAHPARELEKMRSRPILPRPRSPASVISGSISRSSSSSAESPISTWNPG